MSLDAFIADVRKRFDSHEISAVQALQEMRDADRRIRKEQFNYARIIDERVGRIAAANGGRAVVGQPGTAKPGTTGVNKP